jgi:hypothetical protein
LKRTAARNDALYPIGIGVKQAIEETYLYRVMVFPAFTRCSIFELSEGTGMEDRPWLTPVPIIRPPPKKGNRDTSSTELIRTVLENDSTNLSPVIAWCRNSILTVK